MHRVSFVFETCLHLKIKTFKVKIITFIYQIAVGITNEAKLMVLMVNYRIMESVVATHDGVADILLKYGMG